MLVTIGLEGSTLWVELLVGSRSCSEVISEGGPYTIKNNVSFRLELKKWFLPIYGSSTKYS